MSRKASVSKSNFSFISCSNTYFYLYSYIPSKPHLMGIFANHMPNIKTVAGKDIKIDCHRFLR